MSKEKVVKLVNANFGKDDLYITLAYTDGYIPNEE